MILIYQDYVHNSHALYRALMTWAKTQAIPPTVGWIDAADILGGSLAEGDQRRPRILVMGGGASRYVTAQLGPQGMQAIRDYVAGGGAYLGICAGAYYAAQDIVWACGTDQEIITDAALGLCPVRATGPIPQLLTADNPWAIHGWTPASIAPIIWHDGDMSLAPAPVLYWAGPRFEGDLGQNKVIASYAEVDGREIPAIIQGHYGIGRYVLSSPHLEVDARAFSLMQVDVPANRYGELASLTAPPHIGAGLFNKMMDLFV
jgi:glutamine amidotransferase-like uncharacterized protein